MDSVRVASEAKVVRAASEAKVVQEASVVPGVSRVADAVVIDLNPTSKLPFVICGETLRRYFRRQGLLLSSCLSFCAVRRFTVIKPVRIANE